MEVRELETNKVLSSASGSIILQPPLKNINELLNYIAIYSLAAGIVIILSLLLWQHHEWNMIKEGELARYNQLAKKWKSKKKIE